MKIFDLLLGKMIKKKDLKNDREYIIHTLMEHPVILELREWGVYRNKVLNISDSAKKEMAEYYIGLLFNELKNTMVFAINDYETYLINSAKLNNLIVDTIDNVKVVALGHGVPSIFLDKFTNYLYTQERILASTYRDLDKYEFYDSMLERSALRLNLSFMLIRCITSEMETVINDMNGALKSALEGSIFETNI